MTKTEFFRWLGFYRYHNQFCGVYVASHGLEERVIGRMQAFEERMMAHLRESEQTLHGEWADLRSETRESIEKLRGELADMRADLTWRMIAVVGFVGTLVAIVNAFVA